MSFSSSQLSIRLGFTLTNNPKDFNVTDATNYAGVTYTDIFGVLKAVDPDGLQFYNNVDYNSPDVDYGVSPSSAQLGPLPLSSALVKTGSYKFTYSVKIVDMLQSYTIVSNNSGAKTFTVVGNIVSDINHSSSANFNCVDTVTTALTILNATYSVQTGLTTVTVDETLGSLTALAAFQFTTDKIFSKEFTQSYTYASPSVCLEWTDDECCSSMTITDVTVYDGDATVTRLHTVSYPVGTPGSPADITSPLQELTISPIYTQTWTDVFTADIETSNGIIDITDAVSGVKEHKVASDSALCQVYACMSKMATQYATFLTTAPARAQEMQKYLTLASAAMNAYTTGKKCGKDGYENNLSLITEIANSCGCGCDCDDCADGIPTQVVGCCENVGGSDFTIVIESPGLTIDISSNTVGTTTTFQIDVSGSWFSSQFATELSGKTINDMADVDTTNLSPSSGQVLIWNSGTGKWERGISQLALVDLTDVDNTGLADQMVLYWNAGNSAFEFKLITAGNLVDLDDVNVVGLANGNVLVYDSGTSKWVNIAFELSQLFDVNIPGITNGQGIKWDSGTSKFIAFSPKLTLESLDDVDVNFNTPTADGDRFQYVSGTGWVNRPLPTFTDLGATYPVNPALNQWTGAYSTFQNFGFAYDPITDEITIRGVINTGAFIAVGTPIVIMTLPNGFYPQSTTAFTCTVGIGADDTIALGEINPANGQMTIYSYIDPATGVMTDGLPAGNIAFSTPIKYYKTI